MRTDHTVLSLDPMYSPLHERIAQLTSVKKYAVTSCVAKRIYLPSFRHFLAVSLIDAVTKEEAEPYQAKIASMSTYHHAYASKVEARELGSEELNYMARFYVGLRNFVIEKGVSLVLLHNESRWYHGVGVALCMELGIPYLVTEQGLIRPYTTVIDPQGCNANSRIDFNGSKVYDNKLKGYRNKFTPNSSHDSFKSMFFFFIFLSVFSLERVNRSRSILRYMHNSYSLRKYAKRVLNKVGKRHKRVAQTCEGAILLLLQLENDSQFLLHSPFKTNQEVIDLVSSIAKEHNCNLAIKLHPLDDQKYILDDHVFLVDGKIIDLANSADAVFTINSSASIDVLKTKTPLVLMGESIYCREGVADKLNADKVISSNVDEQARQSFLSYLHDEYLVHGAGYSFCDDHLKHKLEQILV